MEIASFCKSTPIDLQVNFVMLHQLTSKFKHICGEQFWASPDIYRSVLSCMLTPPFWGVLPQSLLTCLWSCSFKYNPAQETRPCEPSATGHGGGGGMVGKRWPIAVQPPAHGGRHSTWFSGGLLWDTDFTALNSDTSDIPHTTFPPSLPFTSLYVRGSCCLGTPSQ